MIELSRHIEILLLENDCVILPEIGGFIAHYVPAQWNPKEKVFFPPTRVIGFNPLLKMNDGLLVQSYMTTYNISFASASKQVEKLIQDLVKSLHEDGQVCLPHIGELKCSIDGTYNFIAYDNKIITPDLYGLDCFEIKELHREPKYRKTPLLPTTTKEYRSFKTRRPYSYILKGIAMIVLVTSLFLFSTPIKNTEVIGIDYAQLSPDMLFKQIEKQSLIVNSVMVSPTTPKNQNTVPQKSTKPIIAKEQKVASVPITPISKRKETKIEVQINSSSKENTPKPLQEANVKIQSKTTSMVYHIIVASLGTKNEAEAMVQNLMQQGFTDAKAILGDGKKRVCIQSYATLTEAQTGLKEFRQNDAYQQAWILRKKI